MKDLETLLDEAQRCIELASETSDSYIRDQMLQVANECMRRARMVVRGTPHSGTPSRGSE